MGAGWERGRSEQRVSRVAQVQEREGKSLIMDTSNRHREKEHGNYGRTAELSDQEGKSNLG